MQPSRSCESSSGFAFYKLTQLLFQGCIGPYMDAGGLSLEGFKQKAPSNCVVFFSAVTKTFGLSHVFSTSLALKKNSSKMRLTKYPQKQSTGALRFERLFVRPSFLLCVFNVLSAFNFHGLKTSKKCH